MVPHMSCKEPLGYTSRWFLSGLVMSPCLSSLFGRQKVCVFLSHKAPIHLVMSTMDNRGLEQNQRIILKEKQSNESKPHADAGGRI